MQFRRWIRMAITPALAVTFAAATFAPLSVAQSTRIRDGNVEWVKVQTGELDGKLVEIFGDLREGDQVAARGTDELRPGTRVTVKQGSSDSKSQGK